MSDEQNILATLEEYAAAYCSKDTDRLMALFDDGDDITLIGIGADELCAGRADVPIRWTVSLVRQGGTWRWLHRHASSPASEQADGDAYPVKEYSAPRI